ncbi:MAG: hypothetical protein ACLU6B_10075 [Lachnospirales bacterium]
MKKKTLVLFLAVASVIVCVIGGTLAWLTATSDQVKNTFTTSDIDITLEETTGVDYKMVPGYTIAKDPKATVLAGSEECYLFVKLEKSTNFDDYLTYQMADGWTALTNVEGVYYRVVNTANMGTEYSALANDQVTVKDSVTKEMMRAAETNEPTLTVTAYASQLHKNNSQDFTAAEAWENVSNPTSN